MVKPQGSNPLKIVNIKPKSKTWKAWLITKGRDYPTQYFMDRMNRMDGNIAVFKHRETEAGLGSWTPTYAVGTWLLFDGHGYSMNLTDSELRKTYEIVDEL